MSNAYLTLADAAKINSRDNRITEATDLFLDAPLLGKLAYGPSSAQESHNWTVTTTAPTAAFRDYNVGIENSKTTETVRNIALKVFDSSFIVDKAQADNCRFGANWFIAREGLQHLRQKMFAGESQVLNGTGDDANGFEGLADLCDGLDDPNVIDAGGAASGDNLTSVYLIRTNNGGGDIEIVSPNEQALFEMGESVSQTVYLDSKWLTVYATPLVSTMGLQYGSTYSVVRVANVSSTTTGENAAGVTDDLLYEALSIFPSGRQPNLIVMNRRSLSQLRESRTATNPSGNPAPRPTELEGIEIVVTDSLTNSEAVVE